MPNLPCNVRSLLGDEPQNCSPILALTLRDTFAETRETQEYLSHFLQVLYSFVTKTSFNGTAFAHQTEALSIELADVGSWVQSVLPNPDLQAQYYFANTMFQVMLDTSERLLFYSRGGTAQHLLRHVIELNVRMLTLYDFHGRPDPSIRGYEEQLVHFYHLLDSWRDSFADLKAVPPSVHQAFGAQCEQVQQLLEALERAVPEPIPAYG